MPARVNLPGASELFRGQPQSDAPPIPPGGRRNGAPSGRVRHDEKITVYLSTDELLALEQARLQIRSEFRLNVDRGRLVREAVAMLVADLAEHGERSNIVTRLQQ